MARQIYVDLSNSLEAWRQKTNILSDYTGDLDNLTTDNTTSIVDAINSIESKLISAAQARQLISVVTSGSGTYVSLTYNSSTGVFSSNVRTLRQSDIPDLDAGKITSGQFSPDRIPALNASKTNAGIFDADRIPELDADKITTGVLGVARIPNLDASKITTGYINVDRIPTIPIGKISTEGSTTKIDPGVLPSNIVYSDNNSTITGEKTFGTVWIGTKITVADGYSIMPLHSLQSNIGSSTWKFNNVYANQFVGTATSALYADLAEKYLADNKYEVGTILKVGGEKEVTVCEPSDLPAGVVSDKPAFIMNEGLEDGTAVALVGRVPLKVHGLVQKGQILKVLGNGIASVSGTGERVGIALETSNEEDVKLIEVMLKL